MIDFIVMQATTEANSNVAKDVSEGVVRWIMTNAVGFGTKLIVAVIIFIIGSTLISVLRKLVKQLLLRKQVDGAVSSFINSLTNTLLKIVLWILIIGVLGIPTVSFAAIIAAAGLAVGMAMKDNLSNFAGGVMILLNKPFDLGDRIVAQSQDGVVKEIGILYTVLLAGDGRTVYIPNGPLSTGSIINYSNLKNQRTDLVFNISYGNDAEELIAIIKDIVVSQPLVLKDPAPFVGVTNVYNGNFDITIKAWTLNADNTKVLVSLNETIYKTLSDKGIFASSCLTVKMASNN